MKYNCFLFLLLLNCSSLFSQFIDFEIKGNVPSIESGEIQIHSGYKDTSCIFKEALVPIINGHFIFKGSLEYPKMVLLSITKEKEYWSRWFYLDPGMQEINLTLKDEDIFVTSDGKSFIEDTQKFSPAIDSIGRIKSDAQKSQAKFEEQNEVAKSDSLAIVIENLNLKMDTFLANYIKTNPDSYVGLSELSYSYNVNSPLLVDAYHHLSEELKASKVGKNILQKVVRLNAVKDGNRFPNFQLLDTNFVLKPLYGIELKKYTLLEFWFSSCGACIQQFGHLKELYDDFHKDGFEIIGITTEITKTKNEWLKSVHKHQLPWPQYWDEDHVQSTQYGIRYFPTNFLLDDEGKIIARNIELSDLSDFLRKNLKK